MSGVRSPPGIGDRIGGLSASDSHSVIGGGLGDAHNPGPSPLFPLGAYPGLPGRCQHGAELIDLSETAGVAVVTATAAWPPGAWATRVTTASAAGGQRICGLLVKLASAAGINA